MTVPPFQAWFPDAPFDATHGYDLDALLQVQPPAAPAGFDDFWQQVYTDARTVDPQPWMTPDPMTGRHHEVHHVDLTTLDGLRLGGWVALPHGPARIGVVISHGYGGRAEPDLTALPADAAAIFPVARGLPTMSLMPEVLRPEDGHVIDGIESVDTYVLRGCAADVWCAATALHQLLERELPLVFVGGSFGGGQGALALPWDERFVAAALNVPSFGQYDLRLAQQCTGSGARVTEYVKDHPQAREVLRYFDAATAATRLQIPTLMACALWDPAVPPAGQFAVHNAARSATGDAARLQVLSAGHAEYPSQVGEAAVWLRGVRDLINAAA